MSGIRMKPRESPLTKPVRVEFTLVERLLSNFHFWSICYYSILEYFSVKVRTQNLRVLYQHINFGTKTTSLEAVPCFTFNAAKRYGKAGLIDVQGGVWDNDPETSEPLGCCICSSYVGLTQKLER